MLGVSRTFPGGDISFPRRSAGTRRDQEQTTQQLQAALKLHELMPGRSTFGAARIGMKSEPI